MQRLHAGLEAELRRSARAAARAGKPLRALVEPCGPGPLAYGVAAVLIEALGRRWREASVLVLAKDPDPAAVARARAGLFRADELAALAPARRARFFAADGSGYLRAARPLREICVFTTRDVSLDARPPALVVTLDGLAAPPATAREENEPQFQTLLAQAEDAVLVCDAGTGEIVEANAAAERLYGRTRAQLLAANSRELVAPESRAGRPEGERRSAQRPKLPQHRRADGGVFPAYHRSSFMMWRGRPSSLWVVRDAAERLRADSVKADSAFMGEVVHELRAPMAVIKGFAETLRLGVRKPSDRAEFLRAIESHTTRAARLIDQLLELSAAQRGRRPRPEPLPAARAVWEVASAFAPLARRRSVSLKVDVAAGLAASADPADFPHILGNLLDNAVKFSARGGSVTIRGRAEGAQAVFSVEDSGPGVPPEDLERVFERFFRGERTRGVKGTGLGLAIVREMAKANGGLAWARNKDGGGAVFCVALPLTPVVESRS